MSIITKLANNGIEAKEITVTKNGVELTGIQINNGTEVNPVVYYTDESEEEIVERCIKAMEMKLDVDVDALTNYANAEDKLRLSLTRNPREDEISELAFCDLYKTVYVEIDSTKTIRVTEKLLEMWDVTADEVFATAEKNLTVVMLGLSEMLFGVKQDGDPIVVTNDTKFRGASAILKAELPDECYMLPSSIHEVMILTDAPNDVHALTEMVQEVNETQVAPEERLADHAYHYVNGTWEIVG